MANEQTSVPLFTAGEVLTAANMNLSAGTGVPVFSNTTTRDAAFGGAGEKVLAEGQLCYLSSTNVVQYYDGAAWATVGPATAGGLTLISATTIGSAVASVTVSSAFSSTYDNYKIVVSGGVASTSCGLRLQLGSTTTGYYSVSIQYYYSNATAELASQNNGANFQSFGAGSTNTLAANAEINNPNLAKNTAFQSSIIGIATGGVGGFHSGFLNDSTQYTAFTVTPSSGTLTGGTIRVYGYANS